MVQVQVIDRSAPLAPMQRMAADHLARSLRESVPVSLHGQTDAGALAALRARLNADPGCNDRPRITYTLLLIKAVAQTLRAHPGLDAAFDGREVPCYTDIHIGVAIALADGNLVVVVLRHADRLPLHEIAEALQDFEKRAAAGSLHLADVQGGTFTVSNGGMVPSVCWTTPTVPSGQAAIIAFGALHEAAAVHEGRVEVRRVLPTSLTFDHLFVNGVPASRFVDDLHRCIAEAWRLEVGR